MRRIQKSWLRMLLLSAVLVLFAAGHASAQYEPDAGTAQAAVKTGLQKINGKRYFIQPDGTHLTGWYDYRGNRYYFNPKQDGAMTIGLLKIDGKYYYFNSNGKMLRNKRWGKIQDQYCMIGPDGAVKKLNSTQVLAVQRLEQLGRKQTLHRAFEWSAKLPYIGVKTNKNAKWFAGYGFTYGRGDCNVQACTFYYMAKMLGYDAHYVKGTVPQANGTNGNHAWVEIDQNGATFVFDPNLNGQYASVYGRNTGYAFHYGATHTYKYQDIKRVN